MKKTMLTLLLLAALALAVVAQQQITVTTKSCVPFTTFGQADTASILGQLAHMTNSAGNLLFSAGVSSLPASMTFCFNGTNSITVWGQ